MSLYPSNMVSVTVQPGRTVTIGVNGQLITYVPGEVLFVPAFEAVNLRLSGDVV